MKITPHPQPGHPGHTPSRVDRLIGRQVVKASAIARDSVALHPVLVAWARRSQLARTTGLPITDFRPRGK